MIRLILEVVVCAAAAYRLTRVVTDDTITAPLRQRLWDRGIVVNPRYTDDGHIVPGGRLGHLYAFVTCPFCVGWWVSLGVFALWRHPWGDLGAWRWCLAAASVAGLQGFLASKEG